MNQILFGENRIYVKESKKPFFVAFYSCKKNDSRIDYKHKFLNLSNNRLNQYTDDFFGGVLVKAASKRSSLKRGDVILNINKKRVSNISELNTALDIPNDRITASIIRDRSMQRISIKLKNKTRKTKLKVRRLIKKICSVREGSRKDFVHKEKMELRDEIPLCGNYYASNRNLI